MTSPMLLNVCNTGQKLFRNTDFHLLNSLFKCRSFTQLHPRKCPKTTADDFKNNRISWSVRKCVRNNKPPLAYIQCGQLQLYSSQSRGHSSTVSESASDSDGDDANLRKTESRKKKLHIPVMVHEVLDGLDPRNGQVSLGELARHCPI